jgi:hypothetical protein
LYETVTSLGSVAVSVVVGVAAWVMTNFFAEPLLYFYRRRRAVRESLLYAANVNAEVSPSETYLATYDELRRHAAAFDALEETAPSLIKGCFRIRKYDLQAASAGIIGFSNSLSSSDGSRARFRAEIRNALRFSRDF